MLEKAQKLNKVEMVRSDISGKLFPVSECEIVVIKIVKAKNEDINSYSPLAPMGTTKEVVDVGKPATEDTIKKLGLDPASPEFNKMMHRKHSVIPPGLKDIFSKPPELL